MCGIVAFKGEMCLGEVLENLEKLEYRGYDSCGVGYKVGGKIECVKSVGNVSTLLNNISSDLKIDLAIGHTRWATHGIVSKNNSHPHMSSDGKFAIVHNGIVENYRELKSKHLRGVDFLSDTDSEVIAQLLMLNYRDDVWDAFKSAIGMLKGSFAIVMINEYDDKMYFARVGSPMVIGRGKYGYSIASDISGLGDIDNISYINDGSIGYIDKKCVVYDKNYNRYNINFCKHDGELFGSDRGEYEHYMLKEIYEIPTSLRLTAESIDSSKLRLPSDIRHIVIIGCGTSYHSGLVGKKYMEQIAGVPTICEIASEYIYDSHITMPGTLGIFISQSGETADTISALKRAKSDNVYTLAITNVYGSTITQLADEVVYLNAGVEICVASTKAYTSQVFALLKLSNVFRNILISGENIKSSIATIDCLGLKDYLSIDESQYDKLYNFDIDSIMCEVMSVVDNLKDKRDILLIGKDYDFITAKEAGLKIKEVTYTFTDAYPCGELKHGTLSLIDDSSVVLAVCATNKLSDKVKNAVYEIKSRGGVVLGVSNASGDCDFDYTIRLPEFHRYLMPLVAVIPFDIIAYKLSVAKGINPDRPRNLAKSVTVE